MTAVRDPGLQPERTSLSWLRTQLVLLGVGVLLYKVSEKNQNTILESNAIILCCFTLLFAYYTKQRFSVLFQNKTTVREKEARIKKLLSLTIFITAVIYGISSLIQFGM